MKLTVSTIGAVIGYSNLLAAPVTPALSFSSVGTLVDLLLKEKEENLDIYVNKEAGGITVLGKLSDVSQLNGVDSGDTGVIDKITPVKPVGSTTRFNYLSDDTSANIQDSSVDRLLSLKDGIDAIYDSMAIGQALIISQSQLAMWIIDEAVYPTLPTFTVIAGLTRTSTSAWE